MLLDARGAFVQCPICRTPLRPEAEECPRCGEMFADPFGEATGPLGMPEDVPGRRETFLYYAGIFLVVVGGPGAALGSWLHDVLRISYLNYDAFDVFGPMNQLVLAVGLILMIVGAVFLFLSTRLSRPADADDGF